MLGAFNNNLFKTLKGLMSTDPRALLVRHVFEEANNYMKSGTLMRQVINKINDIQTTIASAVDEQTATTNEIGRNVGEAAKGSNEIAQNITGVAQAAQSTTSGANDTQGAAGELARMASELQTLVGRFTY